MANAACLRVWGKPAEEVIGRSDRELYEDRSIAESVIENDRAVMESGQGQVLEEVVQTRDGVRTYLSAKSPYRDEKGEIVGVLGIARDITERKRAEEALRGSEERLRALFENSLDAVFLTIPDGSIVAANQAAEDMFGYSTSEFRALGRAGILDAEDPRLAAALEERQRTGRLAGARLTGVRKSGERFPVEVDSVVLPVEPSQTFVLMRDVTKASQYIDALRESEERFRSLFESMEEGVVLHELIYDDGRPVDYRILDANPAFEHQTGMMARPRSRPARQRALRDREGAVPTGVRARRRER